MHVFNNYTTRSREITRTCFAYLAIALLIFYHFLGIIPPSTMYYYCVITVLFLPRNRRLRPSLSLHLYSLRRP
jgi:hypothetical protein